MIGGMAGTVRRSGGSARSVGTGLLVVLASLSACREETRIDFVTEQAWIDVDRDSGDVVIGSGASVRVVTQAYAGYTVRASGLVKGSRVVPIEGTGSIVVEGHFDLEVSASVDLTVGSFSGPVDAPPFDFEVEIASFDPFLLGESITVVGGMPVKQVVRTRLLPGVFLVLETAPGSFIPTYEGVCLETAEGAAQYTARIAIEPDFRYLASVEVAAPLGGIDIIGPVGIELDLPPLVLQSLDLGTYSTSSGQPVDGLQPCDGGGGSGDSDGGSSDGGSSDGADGSSG